MYGERVAIHHSDYDRLPYGDRMFNLVVSDTAIATGELPGNVDEVLRVLRPSGGVVCIGQPQKSNSQALRTWLGGHAEKTRITDNRGVWATYRSEPLADAGENGR